ncbi:IS66 family transposase zinc-finger binding domain-containing protein [Weissella confusa]|uniref:IS66 family transposase zinc-finger binding domain-containing protein n=1 Tax=Weissella confusa TaxID=1583 RepID=UPI003A4E160A
MHYELSEKDCFCDVCDTYMTELSQKKVQSTVKYIPAKLIEQQHIQHSYECPNCKLHSDKATIPIVALHLLNYQQRYSAISAI